MLTLWKLRAEKQAIQMLAYFARLGMVIGSWRLQEAEPPSSRQSWTALTVLICSLTVSPSCYSKTFSLNRY